MVLTKLLFVSYENRSGSTFLLNTLSKIKGILVCPEANQIFDLFLTKPLTYSGSSKKFKTKFHFLLVNDPFVKTWNLTKIYKNNTIPKGNTNLEMFLNLLEDYKNKFLLEANVVVYKHNSIYQIFEVIERARRENIYFVTLIRDVRDVFISQRKTLDPYSGKVLNNNPLITSYSWRKMIIESIKRRKNENVSIILFENLISDFKGQINILLKKINYTEKWGESESSLWIENRLSPSLKGFHQNIHKEAQPDKIIDWQLESIDLDIQILEKISGKELLLLGYPLTQTKNSNLLILSRCFYLKIRILLKIDRY